MPDAERGQRDPLKNRIWRVGAIEFDEARRELRVGGTIRAVEAKPLLLLETLLARAGDVVRKEELLAIVWQDRTVVEQSLTTAVSKLRSALGDEGRAIIEAVHGIGYRIGLPIELRAAPERPRLAFTLKAGDPVPNRAQWCLMKPLGRSTARDVWSAANQKTGELRVFKFADTTERVNALRREAALSRILFNALGERHDLVRISEWNFDTRPFFIESPFGGDSLPDWAAAQGGITSIPLAERIAIVARIARTAGDAHAIGVLHRDIKPANVLVSGDRDGLIVRLVDFGSGRLTESAVLEAVTIEGLGLTGASASEVPGLSGTLHYMAPEIVAGGPPTIAADVYAIGILLYQMIVGDFDRPLGAGWEADISDPLLRDDVREAASSDAKRRLTSALVLAERLEGLEKRRAEHDRHQRIEQEASRLARQLERTRARRPWVAGAAAALAGGLLLSIVFGVDAVHRRNEARHEAGIARAVNQFLTVDLLGRGNPAHSGKADETLMEAADNAEPKVAYRLAKEPLVAGSIYLALASAFESRSAFKEARAAYDKAAAAFETAQGPHAADAVILMLRRANMEALSGEAGSATVAKTLIKRAEPDLPQLGSRQSEAQVWLMTARASLDNMAGDQMAAAREAMSAADNSDALPEVFDEDFRLVLRQRQAVALLRGGEVDQADVLLQQLEHRRLAVVGPNDPDTLLVEVTLARIMLLRNQYVQAAAALDRLYPEMVVVFGATNRQTLIALSVRAQARIMSERYDEAVEDDQAVYASTVSTQGATAFLALASQNDAASAECRKGDGRAGLRYALSAYNSALKANGSASGLIGITSEIVAFCLITLKEYIQADLRLRSIEAASAGKFESSTPEEFRAEFDLLRAEVAKQAGDMQGARALLILPERVFAKLNPDPFMSRWTHRLMASLTPPTPTR